MSYVSDMPLIACGDEIITGLSAKKSLTPATGAMYALLQAQSQNVRLRDSGTDPTASAGLILTAGGTPLFYSGRLSDIEVIEEAASATLFVTYYKPRTYAHGATPLG